MKKKTFSIVLLLGILSGVFAVFYAGQHPQAEEKHENMYLMVKDDNGRETVLKRKPERIVVLSPSFLEILDRVDGQVVGRATSRVARIPQRYETIAEVGYVYRINVEEVVGLQPDLVIAYKGLHENLLPLFEANHIPAIVLNLKTYQDVKRNCALLGAIAGHGEQGKALAAHLDEEVRAAARGVKTERERAVILHATMMDLCIETEDSIAGNIAAMLGVDLAIRAGDMPAAAVRGMQTPDKIVYSFEKLVEVDPDVIFITSMGAKEGAVEKFAKEMKCHPAWADLRAVKGKRVFVLPERLFLLNPGLRYPETVRYMAERLNGRTEDE